MSIWQAMVLAVIQGVAEFLPISSSGHLVIAQKLMRLATPPVAFDIWLHVATLGAIFWWLGRELKLSWKMMRLVIIGSIPAGIVGLLVQPYLENIFNSLVVVGTGLLITGAVLLMTKRLSRLNQIDVKTALLIGLAQAVAILPGVSRSGSTIATALIVGVSRQKALQFSLLLAIPAIGGAQVLELSELINNQNDWGINLIGFGVAFIVGLLALKLLTLILRHKQLHYFGWYCLMAGGATLLWRG